MIETVIQAYVAADEAFVANDRRLFSRCIALAWDLLRYTGYEGPLQW